MSTNILTINKQNGITVFDDVRGNLEFKNDLRNIREYNEVHESNGTQKNLTFEELSIQSTSEVLESPGFYVHELEGVKLFSKEDLSDLAMQIEDAKNEIKTIQAEIHLTRNEKLALKKEVKDIETKITQTRKSLIESNLRTVFSIAKKNINRGLSFLELIQSGKIGLEKAVDTYESSQGLDFFAYTVFWIRLSIAQALVANRRNKISPEGNGGSVVAMGKKV